MECTPLTTNPRPGALLARREKGPKPMTDKPTGPDLTPAEKKVLAYLIALGEATAAAIGAQAGFAYSTTTPKLRKLEDLGLAERFRDTTTSQMLWRPTTTRPHAGTAAPDNATTSTDDPATPADTRPDSDPLEEKPAGDAVPQTADVHDEEPVEAPDEDDAGPEVVDPSADATTHDGAAHTDPDHADRAADHVDTVTDGGEPAGPDQATQPATDPHDADGPDTSALPAPARPAEADLTVLGAAHTTAGEPNTAPSAPDEQAAGEPTPAVPTRKRAAGELEATVLAILRSDPDQQYKTNDLRKLVDQTDDGKGLPRASAGAVSNAADKLGRLGLVVAGEAKPATFQAAPPTD
jgi:hypothetical protein